SILCHMTRTLLFTLFYQNTPSTSVLYPLSLHDALPISSRMDFGNSDERYQEEILPHVSRTFALTIPQLPPGLRNRERKGARHVRDRKSTRLNSSHRTISYAVFCLKKKNKL